jgi:hypothetical protein
MAMMSMLYMIANGTVRRAFSHPGQVGHHIEAEEGDETTARLSSLSVRPHAERRGEMSPADMREDETISRA